MVYVKVEMKKRTIHNDIDLLEKYIIDWVIPRLYAIVEDLETRLEVLREDVLVKLKEYFEKRRKK